MNVGIANPRLLGKPSRIPGASATHNFTSAKRSMLPCWPNTEILRDAFVVIFLPGGLPDILCRQLYSISLTLWMVATCYRISIFHVLPARLFEYITELLHIHPFQSWKRTHLSLFFTNTWVCVACLGGCWQIFKDIAIPPNMKYISMSTFDIHPLHPLRILILFCNCNDKKRFSFQMIVTLVCYYKVTFKKFHSLRAGQVMQGTHEKKTDHRRTVKFLK